MSERDQKKGPKEFHLSWNENLPLEELTAISTVDGRYAEMVTPLRSYVSEFALIRSRVMIEAKYLQALSQVGIIRPFTDKENGSLDAVWQNFDLEDARRVKTIERKTRHDVKSMEYVMKDRLGDTTLIDVIPMVHFALTSEDPTNLAQNINIAEVKNQLLVPAGWGVVDALANKAREWKEVPMLGRTHGREATGTTVGKEVALYAHRLARKIQQFEQMKLTGKMTGSVGNLSEHVAGYPNEDWIVFAKNFVESLGLEPQEFTTQIEPHDRWAEMFHKASEIMGIIDTIDKNLWTYNSHNYFFLPPRSGQIGSSIMPHKGRNPIDLEGSEGNAQFAQAMFDFFARIFPDSRMQRHLADSTIARNIGFSFAIALISFDRAKADIQDFVLREDIVRSDIEDSWPMLAAGIQTRLRFLGIPDAYEQFDEMAKEGPITEDRLHSWVEGLSIEDAEKIVFQEMSPSGYTGKAVRLTEMMLDEIDAMRNPNR